MTTEEPTNILVVDDLPEKLLVYRTILGELNQNLVTAGSGDEALRAVLAHDFAVILLDVNMPGMNGLETAALIRKRKRSAHTPIIFLTAFADEVRAAEGYAQGAVDYIATPVVPAILRAKVRVFADLYRMTQQVKRQAEERIALAEERAKRAAAEEATRRSAFLAEVSRVLADSLDPDTTARTLARQAVPFLADLAGVTLAGPAGAPWQTELAWATDGPAATRQVTAADAPRDGLRDAVDRALAQGQVEVLPEVDAEAIDDGPRVRAAIVLPLTARGHTLGALTLGFVAGRTYDTDLALAEELASRAGIALDNARLYHELQLADHQKNEFLSMLAHELRNPLAPIRNASEVLNHTGPDPARVRWAQGVIGRQVAHLTRLVDDLLDVSRLTQGKIRLVDEPVELAPVVAQAVEAARPVIDKSRHHLEVLLPDYPVQVRGDPARLVQVFSNLLNNAAKYTDPGGRITLSAELGARTAGRTTEASGGLARSALVEVRVRDTGIGIARELLPRVFDLFTQANRSLDRSQGGLGVGLTLVRKLVEMHSGTVEAHSAGIGHGSEFVVRLPAIGCPTEGAEMVPATPPAPPTRSLRVVLVDDNIDGVESLADLVGLLGHQARTAHDGPTGIEIVRAFDPDVVFLDIGLPGMDGYEVARRLRAEVGARAVLIALSGYGRDEDRARSHEAGCEQHFVKPIEVQSLQALFARLVTAASTR